MKRIILGPILVFILIIPGVAIYVTIDGLLSRPAPADVAIAFGSMVQKSGLPSARLKARLNTAVQLYRSHMVKTIIVSGGHGKEGFDESAVMKTYLLGESLPAKDVYVDDSGVDTKQTCQNALRLMKARHWQTADIVTQYFHISRAELACRQEDIRVAGAAYPRYSKPGTYIP